MKGGESMDAWKARKLGRMRRKMFDHGVWRRLSSEVRPTLKE